MRVAKLLKASGESVDITPRDGDRFGPMEIALLLHTPIIGACRTGDPNFILLISINAQQCTDPECKHTHNDTASSLFQSCEDNPIGVAIKDDAIILTRDSLNWPKQWTQDPNNIIGIGSKPRTDERSGEETDGVL